MALPSRSFFWGLAWRVGGIGVLWFLAAGAAYSWKQAWLAVLLSGLAIGLTFSLLRYVNDTNRRLARFFESVRYSDFAIRFSSGKEKGASFDLVSRQFNEVLEAFRQTRAEKEANLLFLNAIVQHLGTGVLAFDAQSGVLLSNSLAFQLLGLYRLHHLQDLPPSHAALAEFVQTLTTKGKILYQPESGRQLSVQGVALNSQGRTVRLLTIQNIHPELQRKELDAWRNLTRVLRHEIMNSVTPIVSLVETMQDIVRNDLNIDEKSRVDGPLADLEEALEVVAVRGRGLMEFVDAYRSFTAVPPPKIETVGARKLLDAVSALAMPELKQAGVQLESFVAPPELTLQADAAQIEMVLINLIKNAREALVGIHSPRITLRAGADSRNRAFIEVEDNGPGIEPNMLDEIFIPFYTSKPDGMGIGLSISQQIMQLHGGDIRVRSGVGGGARFVLAF